MKKLDIIIKTMKLYRGKELFLGYWDKAGNFIEEFVTILHNNDLYATILRNVNDREETYMIYYDDIRSLHGSEFDCEEFEHEDSNEEIVDDDGNQDDEKDDVLGKVWDDIPNDAEAAKRGSILLKNYIKNYGYVSENECYNSFNFTQETEPDWYKNLEFFISCCTNPIYKKHDDLGLACSIDHRKVSDEKKKIRLTIQELIKNNKIKDEDLNLVKAILPFVQRKRRHYTKNGSVENARKKKIYDSSLVLHREESFNTNPNESKTDIMCKFRSYVNKHNLTRGIRANNVQKFFDFAEIIIAGKKSLKDACEAVNIGESGGYGWYKKIKKFIIHT